MNIIKAYGLPNRQSKFRQMPVLEQSAKYSSRQNSGYTTTSDMCEWWVQYVG